jgi:hypothetical protein
MTVILMDIGDVGSHERFCESELVNAARMGKEGTKGTKWKRERMDGGRNGGMGYRGSQEGV